MYHQFKDSPTWATSPKAPMKVGPTCANYMNGWVNPAGGRRNGRSPTFPSGCFALLQARSRRRGSSQRFESPRRIFAFRSSSSLAVPRLALCRALTHAKAIAAPSASFLTTLTTRQKSSQTKKNCLALPFLSPKASGTGIVPVMGAAFHSGDPAEVMLTDPGVGRLYFVT